MAWKVKLVIRSMGRSCPSCRQEYECEVEAKDHSEAVSIAKIQSGANTLTHQFSVMHVKQIN